MQGASHKHTTLNMQLSSHPECIVLNLSDEVFILHSLVRKTQGITLPLVLVGGPLIFALGKRRFAAETDLQLGPTTVLLPLVVGTRGTALEDRRFVALWPAPVTRAFHDNPFGHRERLAFDSREDLTSLANKSAPLQRVRCTAGPAMVKTQILILNVPGFISLRLISLRLISLSRRALVSQAGATP